MSTLAQRKATRAESGDAYPFDIPTYLFHLFVVVDRLRDLKLDEGLKPLDLNVSRHRAMAVLSQLAPCTMKELSDFAAVDRTTMTRIVDQLVAAGWVVRETPKTDRRQVVLTLTESGDAVYRQALRVIYKINRQILADLPDELQRGAIDGLRTMAANLIDDPARAKKLIGWAPK